MSASLNVAIIDLDIKAEDSVRACAVRVHIVLGNLPHLLTVLDQLSHLFGRAHSFAGKVLDNDLTTLVSHIEVALIFVQQIVDVFVVNL